MTVVAGAAVGVAVDELHAETTNATAVAVASALVAALECQE
jgi:hypothetical protein